MQLATNHAIFCAHFYVPAAEALAEPPKCDQKSPLGRMLT